MIVIAPAGFLDYLLMRFKFAASVSDKLLHLFESAFL